MASEKNRKVMLPEEPAPAGYTNVAFACTFAKGYIEYTGPIEDAIVKQMLQLLKGVIMPTEVTAASGTPETPAG
jgi:hypothetical protein